MKKLAQLRTSAILAIAVASLTVIAADASQQPLPAEVQQATQFQQPTFIQDIPQQLQTTFGQMTTSVAQAGQNFSTIFASNAEAGNSHNVWSSIGRFFGVQGFLDPKQAKDSAPGANGSQPTILNGTIAAQSILGMNGQNQAKAISEATVATVGNATNSRGSIQPLITLSTQQVSDSAASKDLAVDAAQKAVVAGNQQASDTLTQMQYVGVSLGGLSTAVGKTSEQLHSLAQTVDQGNKIQQQQAQIESERVNQGAIQIEQQQRQLQLAAANTDLNTVSTSVITTNYNDGAQAIKNSRFTASSIRAATGALISAGF